MSRLLHWALRGLDVPEFEVGGIGFLEIILCGFSRVGPSLEQRFPNRELWRLGFSTPHMAVLRARPVAQRTAGPGKRRTQANPNGDIGSLEAIQEVYVYSASSRNVGHLIQHR